MTAGVSVGAAEEARAARVRAAAVGRNSVGRAVDTLGGIQLVHDASRKGRMSNPRRQGIQRGARSECPIDWRDWMRSDRPSIKAKIGCKTNSRSNIVNALRNQLRRSEVINLTELRLQIADVSRRVDFRASDALDELLRLELGAVDVDLLAEPGEQR